ncbi:hypothetical protein RHGRI_012575 [Rhododendron griersonianum]|uniref:Uncharacterized protein n=1 Tax=Rhododendron griersonianum TaxID=479676 RepID=A0AAV6KR12_9ERIC|nr:hypothetical protein RHGRI_012571 [Rhododendron griersonianum]KAG5555085.1 hypothetical protein RHGRI_012575 [Rhododendron griersonianum]
MCRYPVKLMICRILKNKKKKSRKMISRTVKHMMRKNSWNHQLESNLIIQQVR